MADRLITDFEARLGGALLALRVLQSLPGTVEQVASAVGADVWPVRRAITPLYESGVIGRTATRTVAGSLAYTYFAVDCSIATTLQAVAERVARAPST